MTLLSRDFFYVLYNWNKINWEGLNSLSISSNIVPFFTSIIIAGRERCHDQLEQVIMIEIKVKILYTINIGFVIIIIIIVIITKK